VRAAGEFSFFLETFAQRSPNYLKGMGKPQNLQSPNYTAKRRWTHRPSRYQTVFDAFSAVDVAYRQIDFSWQNRKTEACEGDALAVESPLNKASRDINSKIHILKG
jgi:hypothetical protein